MGGKHGIVLTTINKDLSTVGSTVHQSPHSHPSRPLQIPGSPDHVTSPSLVSLGSRGRPRRNRCKSCGNHCYFPSGIWGVVVFCKLQVIEALKLPRIDYLVVSTSPQNTIQLGITIWNMFTKKEMRLSQQAAAALGRCPDFPERLTAQDQSYGCFLSHGGHGGTPNYHPFIDGFSMK